MSQKIFFQKTLGILTFLMFFTSFKGKKNEEKLHPNPLITGPRPDVPRPPRQECL